MKNYLKNYCKKTMSVLLATLMLLSCWVWVAPKAEAAYGAEKYRFNLTFACTDDQDDGDLKTIYFRLYYKTNCGTGDLKYIDLGAKTDWIKNTGSRSWNEDTVSGWQAGYFPLYACFGHERADGTISRSLACNATLVVMKKDGSTIGTYKAQDDSNTADCVVFFNTSRDGWTRDTTQGSHVPATPYLNSVEWTTVPQAVTTPANDTGTTSTKMELRGKDQYGYWYPGTTTYSISSTMNNSAETTVGGSYAYIGSSGTTSVSTKDAAQTIYCKSVPMSLLGTSQSYKVTCNATYKASYGTASKDGSKPITVTQGMSKSWTYYASDTGAKKGVVAPTAWHDTVSGESGTTDYGTANSNTAKIGTNTSVTTGDMVFHSDLRRAANMPNSDDNLKLTRTGYKFLYFKDKNSDCYYYTEEDEKTLSSNKTIPTEIDVDCDSNQLKGWWEPTLRTITFLNADGSLLWQNDIQPYDHKILCHGLNPKYETGNSMTYDFAGWINMQTGEMVNIDSNEFLQNKSGVYEYASDNCTYMACYTAHKEEGQEYEIRYDYNGNGIIDAVDERSADVNRYYKRVKDVHDAPTLADYKKASTAQYDYVDPKWVDMSDGSELTEYTRIVRTPQEYEVAFTQQPVNYSLTLITGSTNGNVDKSGDQYIANASNGVKDKNATYTWNDTITLPDPGGYADGEYSYEFLGWRDTDDPSDMLKPAGYALSKAANANDADIYTDEYIRADGDTFVDPKTGAQESSGKNTKTYQAVYSRQGKIYSVSFVDEAGEQLEGCQWSGEYQTKVDVTAPTDPVKEETDRYTYVFAGWDNTKTSEVENYSAEYINSFYDENLITADAVYKPIFAGTYHYYVTFLNYDGTTINGWVPDKKWYTAGDKITAEELPSMELLARPVETVVYTYEVEDWATAVGAKLVPGTTTVTDDITYIAQLKQTYQKYDVEFYDEDGTTLIGKSADVTYGDKPTEIPTAVKPAGVEYSYQFAGWDNIDTTNLTETYTKSEEFDAVRGPQKYRAVYKEVKRPYIVKFMVPATTVFTGGETPVITGSDYKFYEWSDSGNTYGGETDKWPAFFYGERISAPTVTPVLTTDPTGLTPNYEVEFGGWFTGENGTGERLTRSVRIDDVADDNTVYYAYYQPVGRDYTVQFYDTTQDGATPYFSKTVSYGTDVSAFAEEIKAQFKPYIDDEKPDEHQIFDKWAIKDADGKFVDATAALTSIQGVTKVYAIFKGVKHTLTTPVQTIAPTYYTAGEEISYCTCEGCGYRETKALEMLKDTAAPQGKIIIRETNLSTDAITTNDSFTSEYTDGNTHYIAVDSVNVMINTNDRGILTDAEGKPDKGRGVKQLYYVVQPIEDESSIITMEQAKALFENGEVTINDEMLTLEQLIEYGVIIPSIYPNDNFTLDGAEGEKYIIYAVVKDNAIDWNAADVEDGVPRVTVDKPNYTYLSSDMIVFDIDSPEITVSNGEDFANEDETAFCQSATIDVTDTFLTNVIVKKADGTEIDNPALTMGTPYTKTLTLGEEDPASVEYTVTATDKNGKNTTYTFTLHKDHPWINGEHVAPTCTENGYLPRTCPICGKYEEVQDDPVTTLGHDYQWVTVTPATCETAGEEAYICSRCGEEKPGTERKTIDALDHDLSTVPEANSVAATCVKEGKNYFKCLREGCTHIEEVEVPALEHNYDEVYTAATCTEGAYTTKTCSRCGDVVIVPDEAHPALGHTFGDAAVEYAETCTTAGLKKTVCTVCGYVKFEIIPAKGHSETPEIRTTIVATCCTKGQTMEFCPDCKQFITGTEVEVPMTDHDFSGEGEVTKAPTCVEKGTKTIKCKNFAACGKTKTVDIDPLGHDLECKETVAPTTTGGGYELWVCKRDGCDYTEERHPVDPLGESKVTIKYFYNGTEQEKTIARDGGSELTYAEVLTAIEVTPAKTGYIFEEAWTYEGTENAVVFPVTLVKDGDITIVAKFRKDEYTVNFFNGETQFATATRDYQTALTEIIADAITVDPTMAPDYYDYTFTGWTDVEGGKIIDEADFTPADVLDFTDAKLTENVSYYAVFTRSGRLFEITWTDWDDNVLTTTQAAFGTVPEAPADEELKLTVGDEDILLKDYEDDNGNFISTWTGEWTPGITYVTQYFVDLETAKGPTYVAVHKDTYKPVKLTFFYDDATAEDIENGRKIYEVRNMYAGDTFILPTTGPVKGADAQYTYVFDAWVPAVEGTSAPGTTLTPADNNFKFIAKYTPNPIYYSVTFTDDSGKVIEGAGGNTYLYDDVITVPETPVKPVPAENAGEFEYVFAGWKYMGITYPATSLPKVTGDMKFAAVFDKVYNDVTVKFMSWNGNEVLKTSTFTYGDSITYNGTPTIARTAQYTYKWLGWNTQPDMSVKGSLGDAVKTNPAYNTADGTMTFYAAFEQTVRTYDIKWIVNDKECVRSLAYGTQIAYPTGSDVPSIANYSTDYRSYTFEGWSTKKNASSPNVASFPTVTATATYYAVFSSKINTVDIVWKNDDGTVLAQKTVNYGDTPVYEGETPVKTSANPAEFSWKFSGWSDQNGKTYAAADSFDRATTAMTYTATYEKDVPKYTVTFFDKENAVITEKTDYVYGDTVTAPADLAGYYAGDNSYSFIGWAANAAVTTADEATANAAKVDFTAATVTGNAAYYPIFLEVAREKFTVTFDAQNGTDATSADYFTNQEVAVPADPEKTTDDGVDGAKYTYVFAGWATTASGKDTAGASTVLEVIPLATATVTYYAQYTQSFKVYSVSFYDDQNRVLSIADYHYGDTAAQPAVTLSYQTRQSVYTFAGWKKTAAATAADFAKDTAITVTETLKLYPQYDSEVRYYTTTFVNEGETYKEFKLTYGQRVNIPEDPEKAPDETYRYEFANWTPIPQTYSDATGEYIFATENRTYTAVYTAKLNKFTVIFYDLKKEAGTSGDFAEPVVPDTVPYSIKSDYKYGDELTLPQAPKDFTTNRKSYKFLGWAAYADENNTVVDFTLDVNKYVKAEEATPIMYKAVYDINDVIYTVTFLDSDGKTEVKKTEAKYNEALVLPEVADKEDDTYTYSLSGWFKNNKLISIDKMPATVTENAVYTANYSSVYKEYTVKFLDAEGEVYANLNQTYHFGDTVVTPAKTPEKADDNENGFTYKFIGWKDTAEGGALYTTVPAVAKDATYQATFDEIAKKYSVKFYIGDTLANETVYKHGDPFVYPEMNTAKASTDSYDFTFEGWAVEKDGDVSKTEQEMKTSTEPVKKAANYYAVYSSTERQYVVTFFDENGAKIDQTSYKYGAPLKVPADPTKTGNHLYTYKFLGWSTIAGSAEMLANVNNSTVKADANYYAIFRAEDVKYTVRFFFEGNAIATYADELYGTSVKGTTEPKKSSDKRIEGGVEFITIYTFAGWATTEGGAVAYAHSSDLPNITKSMDYYAVFTSREEKNVPKYTVKFVKEGNEISSNVYEVNSTVAVPTKGLERNYTVLKHFNFLGWSEDSEAKVQQYTSAQIPKATKDVTYYAIYQAISHNLVKSTDSKKTYVCNINDKSKTTWECTGCAYSKTEEGTAQHHFVESGRYEPTCRNNGTKFLTCTGCGKTMNETIGRTGNPVSVYVKDRNNSPVANASITVYKDGKAIDSTTTNDAGLAVVYVPGNGNYETLITASGYENTNGYISVIGSNATNHFDPPKKNVCNCTCHKGTFWSKLYTALYKVLHAMFKVKCCNDASYL